MAARLYKPNITKVWKWCIWEVDEWYIALHWGLCAMSDFVTFIENFTKKITSLTRLLNVISMHMKSGVTLAALSGGP